MPKKPKVTLSSKYKKLLGIDPETNRCTVCPNRPHFNSETELIDHLRTHTHQIQLSNLHLLYFPKIVEPDNAHNSICALCLKTSSGGSSSHFKSKEHRRNVEAFECALDEYTSDEGSDNEIAPYFPPEATFLQKYYYHLGLSCPPNGSNEPNCSVCHDALSADPLAIEAHLQSDDHLRRAHARSETFPYARVLQDHGICLLCMVPLPSRAAHAAHLRSALHLAKCASFAQATGCELPPPPPPLPAEEATEEGEERGEAEKGVEAVEKEAEKEATEGDEERGEAVEKEATEEEDEEAVDVAPLVIEERIPSQRIVPLPPGAFDGDFIAFDDSDDDGGEDDKAPRALPEDDALREFGAAVEEYVRQQLPTPADLRVRRAFVRWLERNLSGVKTSHNAREHAVRCFLEPASPLRKTSRRTAFPVPRATLFAFGSSRTSVCLRDGDVDLFLDLGLPYRDSQAQLSSSLGAHTNTHHARAGSGSHIRFDGANDKDDDSGDDEQARRQRRRVAEDGEEEDEVLMDSDDDGEADRDDGAMRLHTTLDDSENDSDGDGGAGVGADAVPGRFPSRARALRQEDGTVVLELLDSEDEDTDGRPARLVASDDEAEVSKAALHAPKLQLRPLGAPVSSEVEAGVVDLASSDGDSDKEHGHDATTLHPAVPMLSPLPAGSIDLDAFLASPPPSPAPHRHSKGLLPRKPFLKHRGPTLIRTKARASLDDSDRILAHRALVALAARLRENGIQSHIIPARVPILRFSPPRPAICFDDDDDQDDGTALPASKPVHPLRLRDYRSNPPPPSQCDINISAPEGVLGSYILSRYIAQCPEIAVPMLVFIKSWAGRRGVADGPNGYANSYCHCLMGLEYLVHRCSEGDPAVPNPLQPLPEVDAGLPFTPAPPSSSTGAAVPASLATPLRKADGSRLAFAPAAAPGGSPDAPCCLSSFMKWVTGPDRYGSRTLAWPPEPSGARHAATPPSQTHCLGAILYGYFRYYAREHNYRGGTIDLRDRRLHEPEEDSDAYADALVDLLSPPRSSPDAGADDSLPRKRPRSDRGASSGSGSPQLRIWCPANRRFLTTSGVPLRHMRDEFVRAAELLAPLFDPLPSLSATRPSLADVLTQLVERGQPIQRQYASAGSRWRGSGGRGRRRPSRPPGPRTPPAHAHAHAPPHPPGASPQRSSQWPPQRARSAQRAPHSAPHQRPSAHKAPRSNKKPRRRPKGAAPRSERH